MQGGEVASEVCAAAGCGGEAGHQAAVCGEVFCLGLYFHYRYNARFCEGLAGDVGGRLVGVLTRGEVVDAEVMTCAVGVKFVCRGLADAVGEVEGYGGVGGGFEHFVECLGVEIYRLVLVEDAARGYCEAFTVGAGQEKLTKARNQEVKFFVVLVAAVTIHTPSPNAFARNDRAARF